MRKSILYSQNFLINKSLVSDLVKRASITHSDIVYEIGAGTGFITEALLKYSQHVVAFEVDEALVHKLTKKFQSQKSLETINGDFLVCSLPSYPYKVFANIPFNISSDVIKKLTQADNPPEESFLVIQRETAGKFTGQPYTSQNSLAAVLLNPWFELKIFYEFSRTDFFPEPRVDVVMLRIKKRESPLINPADKRLYQDFIVSSFNRMDSDIIALAVKIGLSKIIKPGALDFKNWFKLFNLFQNQPDKSLHHRVTGSYAKLQNQQELLEKIHRTRLDKNWKKHKHYSSKV